MRVPLTLTITVNEAGQVSVTGPIDNLVQCYGLLELAKDIVRAHQASKPKAAIAAPGNGEVLRFGAKP